VIRLAPIPWHAVTPGTVVLIDGIPRTVLAVHPVPHSGTVRIFAEGIALIDAPGTTFVQPVQLDETDAMITLFAAGFTPEVISRDA